MQEYMTFFSNHTVLVLSWFGLSGALAYSFVQSKISGVNTIGCQEATQLINQEEAIVVDVRSAEEFRKGHIVSAKNLPLSQIQNKKFTGIENKKQIPIILVCESGMRSSGAAKVLRGAEFDKVYNLRGGMGQWRSDKLPVSKK